MLHSDWKKKLVPLFLSGQQASRLDSKRELIVWEAWLGAREGGS